MSQSTGIPPGSSLPGGGIRGGSRTSVARPILVGMALLVIPLLLTLYFYLDSIGGSIRFAQRERCGIGRLKPVAEAMEALAALPADTAEPVVQRLAGAALAEAAAVRCDSAGKPGQEEASAAQAQLLLTRAPKEQATPRDAALVSLRAYFLSIGDDFQLTLDPDLDTHYAIEFEFDRFLDGGELINRYASAGDARERNFLSSDLYRHLALVRNGLATATMSNTAYRGSAKTLYPALAAPLQAYLSAITALAGQPDQPTTPERVTAARRSLLSLEIADANWLDLALQARIAWHQAQRWKVSLMLLALLAVVSLSAFRLVRRAVTRLADLAQLSRRMAQGELGLQTRVEGDDEIAELAAAFNHMASQLKQDYEQIEEQVRQRTSELAVARDDALAADRAKSNFLANMSHELRTPMNAIIGLVDLTLQSELTSKQRGYLGKVHNASKNLLAIVNDILDFSRMENGKLAIENVDFDPGAVLERLAATYGPQARAKGLEFQFRIDPQLPAQLLGDRARIGQILGHYCANAIKFTERGHIEVSVQLLASTQQAARLRFAVEDSGIGIPPGQQSLLFQAFHQGDASSTRKFGGTGVGLSIVKHLAGLMHGEVGVDSEPGRGSTFWFVVELGVRSGAPAKSRIDQLMLALDQAQKDEGAGAEDMQAAGSGSQAAAPASTDPGKTEDPEQTRQLLAELKRRIEDFDTSAGDIVEELVATCSAPEVQSSLKALERSVAEFEFEQAGVHLAALTEAWNALHLTDKKGSG